jgi:hypothetical protein
MLAAGWGYQTRYALTELAGINLEISRYPLFQELAWSVATNWPIARECAV